MSYFDENRGGTWMGDAVERVERAREQERGREKERRELDAMEEVWASGWDEWASGRGEGKGGEIPDVVRLAREGEAKGERVVLGTFVAPNGMEVEVGEDGRLWKRTAGLAVAIVPMRERDLRAAGMVGETKPELLWWDEERLPGVEVLGAWKRQMQDGVDGEMVVCMARKPSTSVKTLRLGTAGCEVGMRWEWKAVVPKQTATMGGFEVKEVREVERRLEAEGWEVVGHAHLHPGAMTGVSRTDLEDYEGRPGLYLVMPRSLNKVARYLGVGGQLFELGVVDVPSWVKEEVGEVGMMEGGEGEAEWQALVTEPVTMVRAYEMAGTKKASEASGWRAVCPHCQTPWVPVVGFCWRCGEWLDSREGDGTVGELAGTEENGEAGERIDVAIKLEDAAIVVLESGEVVVWGEGWPVPEQDMEPVAWLQDMVSDDGAVEDMRGAVREMWKEDND